MPPKRRLWIVGGGVALLVGAFVAGQWFGRPARRNVILVTLDTTRADRIGCYGYANARTSALDAMAREGVLVERAYTPVPMTLPSHATMLTGLYPPEHGLHVNDRGRLGDGIPVLAEMLRDARYATAAFLGAFVLNAKFGLNRGFQVYDDGSGGERIPDRAHNRSRSGDLVVDAALGWLDTQASGPFFCWIHLFDPHRPYDSRRELFGAEFASEPYDAGIAFVDMQIARLREFLKTRGLSERTLLVIVGDHGEGLFEHDEPEHGYQLYDTTLRVPLLFAGPRFLKPDHRIPTPISLVDLTPTILDCVGIQSAKHASGKSIKSGLEGNAIEGTSCYAETDVPFMNQRWSPQQAVISDRWKFIRSPRVELYDLVEDRHEYRNLAARHPDKVAELTARLDELRADLVPAAETLVNLTLEEQRILESLGYAAGRSASTPADAEQRLPDVKDMMPYHRIIEEARGLVALGKSAEAERKLRAVLESVPQYPSAQILLGQILLDQDRLPEAAGVFERLSTERPDRDDAIGYWADVLAAQGHHQEAIVQYRKALAIRPDVPVYRFGLAYAEYKLGNRDAAIAELEEALRSDPRFVAAHLQLSDLLTESGRDSEAKRHSEAAARLDPQAAAAHRSRARSTPRPTDVHTD